MSKAQFFNSKGMQLEHQLFEKNCTAWRAYKFIESLRGEPRDPKLRKEIIDLVWEKYLTEEERKEIATLHEILKEEGRA